MEKEEEAARSKRKISEAADKPETNGVSADIIWDTLDRGEKMESCAAYDLSYDLKGLQA